MKFYHVAPTSTLQNLMRGDSTVPIPTFCPTSDLIVYGILTLYCQYERPLAFRLSRGMPVDPGYRKAAIAIKLGFEEREDGRNRFTLKRLLKNETLPQGAALVFWMPKNWERKQNRCLIGGTITWVIDDLVTVFQNNLMQVINPKSPHNARLYPDGNTKLEAASNIYAYAQAYLREYQRQGVDRRRIDRQGVDPRQGIDLQFLKDPRHTAISLMNADTLAEFKREKLFVLTLKTITSLLGDLVGFYRKNQAPKELEDAIVREVLALPKDKLKYGYL